MLTFDAAKHEYRDGGKVIPSVTQILQPLSNFDFVDPDVLAAAQDFGTAVHLACELDDNGTLDESALDPELLPYLLGWRKFMTEHHCKWEATELKVYHHAMGYAGTLDRVGLVDGDRSMVDIKSGTRLFPSTGPQTAAYAQAYAPLSARSFKRYAVRLFPNGYELKQYTSPTDWATFASLITLQTFCSQHAITLNFKERSHV